MKLKLACRYSEPVVDARSVHPLFAVHTEYGSPALTHVLTGYKVADVKNLPHAKRIVRALLKKYPAKMWRFTNPNTAIAFKEALAIIRATK